MAEARRRLHAGDASGLGPRRKRRLLQTESLAGREQFNRLANTPFPRLSSFGCVNPHHEITPVRRSKRLKVLPCAEVRPECFGNVGRQLRDRWVDRKSTRLNSSHRTISYAVFCLKKKKR